MNVQDELVIKRVDLRKHIAIKDEEGNVIGTAIYDPKDPISYQKLLSVFDTLMAGNTNIKDIKIDEKDINKDPKSIEDFEKMQEVFGKIENVVHLTIDTVDQAIIDINSIFGEGICELMMFGGKNLEHVLPLLERALVDFTKERKTKTQKYTRTSNVSVLK